MSDDGRLVAGRYLLGKRIGSGAMGIVWQAQDQRLHRTIAVKQLLLQPGLSAAESDEAKQRSMREGRIAARLQHPHAIAVYDVAEDDGQPWLIMEYLPSKSLSAVLSERGTLPPREVARIGTQVASALAAAHNAGIVHRDVKPGNVLLGDDGTVKITDFGISRATGDVTVTATGMLAGTPAYLAPEVAKGYDPGPPSDVFSLGSTLYAAIEGMPPFGLNENTIALLHQVASGQITPPRQAGPLTAMLMKLLRPEPEDRPTMAQAKEELAAVAAGRSIPDNALAAGPPLAQPWRGAPPAVAARSQSNGNRAGQQNTRLDARPVGQPAADSRHAGAATIAHGAPARPARPSAKPASSASRSKNSKIVAGVAIVAAAIVGILMANMLSSKNNGNANHAAGTSSSTSSSATQPSEPEPSAAAPTFSGDPQPQDMQAAIKNYFVLAASKPDQAWAMLNSTAQGAAPGGLAGFTQQWAKAKNLSVSVVGGDGAYWQIVEVRYKKDGQEHAEKHDMSLQYTDQRLLISRDRQMPQS
ncbi:protein kinase [Solihabitans fulvus]|uniref:non-specific serine/threonine protein kinase n=1 Tax=Solihabitans fulvus TaxID=1892852 RepID=A0A5B2XNB8_9PSEU|nr:serine/threonine-protein kinase [Solihabitans fulvus]KAA2264645.1 protein kinase [Solihabitans fulvus]